MATIERINSLLAELEGMRGMIPRDMSHMFSGIRFKRYMFAPAPLRVPCTALVKGRPCKNKCCDGLPFCGIHIKASTAAPKETPARCGAMTAKGTQCRCKVYRKFSMCKRHAKKEGLLPDAPTECAVCYENMDETNRKETACGHFFHTTCLYHVAVSRSGIHVTRRGTTEMRGPCPMCRTPFRMKAPLEPA